VKKHNRSGEGKSDQWGVAGDGGGKARRVSTLTARIQY